ncbi:hypothetical protein BDW02DRAFT_573270 [Decorospora gaudefroyi]|uniref:Uncharacterized protein n=1 Tax=Decorospora gaudefroyi TaxID=184978 RepID=A0A6A5K049_9PLEO|nr:hypothetical protein BDW02DRAFT_573270 [Decorospora gaudefroyi]
MGTEREGGRLNIDTRPCPTASFFQKTDEYGHLFDGAGGAIESISTSTDGHEEKKTVPANTITTSSVPAEMLSKTTMSPAPSPSISTAITGASTSPITLSGGAILAITISSIIGLTLPILALALYLKRCRRKKRQMKQDGRILKEVLDYRVLTERAQEVGLKRLQDALSRKWAETEATAQLLGRPVLELNEIREMGCIERRSLRRLFEQGGGGRRAKGEKALPSPPVETDGEHGI